MDAWKKTVLVVIALFLLAGCSRPVLKSYLQPSREKDQYLRIKRVAIFPFENYSETKDADRIIDALLSPALYDEEVFDEMEDTRFVRDVMKKLKITATDILDKEVVKKLGDEMNVQGILYGKIVTFGKGKEKEAGTQVTMDMVLLEPSTGNVLWMGNVSSYGGLTAGKVFGVTEGKTDIEVARSAVHRLASSLASEVEQARARERKGILEQLKSQTGKIQEDLNKAKTEAQAIKDTAAKEAEGIKSDLELQKAAVEAEKEKTEAAQQAIEQEKLKVEMERKKIEEERQKLEEAKKAAEQAIQEEAVTETVPPELGIPAPPAPEGAPSPPAAPPAEAPKQ
jgi:DNA polymerase III gamma/tau subunit